MYSQVFRILNKILDNTNNETKTEQPRNCAFGSAKLWLEWELWFNPRTKALAIALATSNWQTSFSSVVAAGMFSDSTCQSSGGRTGWFYKKAAPLSLMMAQTSKHAGALVFASSMALCLHPSHQEQGQGGSSLATREFTMYIFFSVSGKFAPRLIFCRVFHAVVPRTSPRNESGWLSQLMKFGCYQEAQCFFHNKPV